MHISIGTKKKRGTFYLQLTAKINKMEATKIQYNVLNQNNHICNVLLKNSIGIQLLNITA